jgi:hypothetical protein
MRQMMIGTLAQRIAMIATLVALCAVVAGCASDATTQPSGNQLRYYGGPKSPMWPG